MRQVRRQQSVRRQRTECAVILNTATMRRCLLHPIFGRYLIPLLLYHSASRKQGAAYVVLAARGLKDRLNMI